MEDETRGKEMGLQRKGFCFACEGRNMLSATAIFGFIFVNIIWGFDLVGRATF